MAKSPVYGKGRNRKHRPINRDSNHPAAGNINMRGKKEKNMSCWCCICIDMRDKMRDKEHKKEMRGHYDT